MTAKEYLSQACHIDQLINSKLEQVQSLRRLASKTTVILHDGNYQSSKNPKSMEDIIVKIIDLENEINRDIDTLINLKRRIMEIINQINKAEYRTLLELRYLCGKTWEEISAEMLHSVRNIHNIHSAALHEFGKIFAVI